MSAWQYGDASADAKGSVRRARELAEAGITSRQPPPPPAAFKGAEPGARGAVISKPKPAPQWPLPDSKPKPKKDSKRDKSSSPENRMRPSAPTPQRPPRPGNVPSLLDSSKIHEYTPSIPSRRPHNAARDPAPTTRQPANNGMMSPESNRDSIASGKPSTISSVGTIPDFPIPTAGDSRVANATLSPPSTGRRSGPPPSARRGNTSFYSVNSYVSPIPEEIAEASDGPRNVRSFASSKVIPSSWGSAPPGADKLRMQEDFLNEDEGDDDGISDDSASIRNYAAEVTLVREASVGKRAKPALRTIHMKSQGSDSSSGDDTVPKPKVTGGAKPVAIPPVPARIFADHAGSTALPRVVEGQHHARQRSDSSTSSGSYDDLEKDPIMVGSPFTKEVGIAGGEMSPRKLDVKRPPPLNLKVVREAEARGSLTSLPDLIRRATKLASNLDRGKTASRLGILDLLDSSSGEKGTRRSGSISDILASFPPPGAATPTGDPRGANGPPQNGRRANPDANFPDQTRELAEEEQPEKSRRCCGLPRWAFVLLTSVIFASIVTLSVVLPIFFIVLPSRRENATPPQPTGVSPESCEAILPCFNGGVSVGDLDSCGCVCVNGFRGAQCAVANDGSCVTLDIRDLTTNYENATVGSALPRLLEGSTSNFSIPLNPARILSLLNAEDISCTTENAIVTFNGANRKRELSLESLIDLSPRIAHRHRTQSHHHAHAVRQDGPEQLEEVVNPSSTSDSDSPSPTNSSSPSPSPIPPRVLDFARIAVLFILEHTGDFQDATEAHDSLQNFFRRATGGGGQTAPSEEEPQPEDEYHDEYMDVQCDSQDFELDFVSLSITFGNGTVVGGMGVEPQ